MSCYAIIVEFMKYKLISDKFRKARGGYSRFLNIYCNNCNTHLFLYQKDGPGPLKRAYLDRIIAPPIRKYSVNSINSVPPLLCNSCKNVIGKPYIYDKENRPAYLLERTSFTKKVTTGVYPPIAKLS